MSVLFVATLVVQAGGSPLIYHIPQLLGSDFNASPVTSSVLQARNLQSLGLLLFLLCLLSLPKLLLLFLLAVTCLISFFFFFFFAVTIFGVFKEKDLS